LSYTRSEDVLRDYLVRTLTTTMLPHLLRYEDRNSMAFSIESRVPFLTRALAELLLGLPEEYIIAPDGTSKSIFRRAMRGVVPESILQRRDKIGFATPEGSWMRAIRPWVDDVLGGDGLTSTRALDPQAVRTEWARIAAEERPFDARVWRWVNLVEWARQFNVAF
jgi:asparagine synthase (glutamine-hydrolysing)